jgi:hypothetical protein
MLGNRRRADEKRFKNFGTGNFGFYTPNFLSSFFLTQNINRESRTLFERRVAVGTKAASLGGCVAL